MAGQSKTGLVGGSLTAADREAARRIAGVAAVGIGSRPALGAEVLAHLMASLLLQQHESEDAEAAALNLIQQALVRTVAIARATEKLANAAQPVQQQSKK